MIRFILDLLPIALPDLRFGSRGFYSFAYKIKGASATEIMQNGHPVTAGMNQKLGGKKWTPAPGLSRGLFINLYLFVRTLV